MAYLLLKSIHIVAAIMWVGSLFLVSFMAARTKMNADRISAAVRITDTAISITWLAGGITWLAGGILVVIGGWYASTWWLIKIVVVVVISAIHAFTHRRWRTVGSEGASTDVAAPYQLLLLTISIALLVLAPVIDTTEQRPVTGSIEELPNTVETKDPLATNTTAKPTINAAANLCQAAPALPPIAESDPGKTIVSVKPGDDISAAAYEAQPNTVILIEPGEYWLDNVLAVTSDNVTIRGNSNNCDDVRLIGKGMENAAGADAVPHGIYTEASFIKVQNLTIEQVYYHAIAIQPGAEAPQIYNVAMLDIGQQFVKVSANQGVGPNNGRLEYSVMKYTDGSPKTDHGPGIGYTQGISLHGGDSWLISNNRFENINTRDDADHLWNPAVLVWDLSSNTIVENNLFIDVDRAIAFGLWERADGQHDHSGGIIRNNMVLMRENLYSQKRKDDADAPIIVWSSPNTQVLHNTVLTNGNTPLSIELRFDSNGATIANNLIDAPISDRSNNEYIDEGNVLFNDTSIFVNTTHGDLHIAKDVGGITDTVTTLENSIQDFDGQLRRENTTYAGADEF